MSAMDKKFYCARIYVTHQCNSHCKYCDTHDEIYKDIKEMSLKQSKELIRQLRNVGVEYIDFTGGEPTLNKNLPEIISFANEIGIKTEVTTNATTGLTDILIQSAKRARKFNISLDTIKPQRYFSIRGVDKLQVVSETVKAVSKIRSDLNLTVPKLMTVVTEENLDDLPELIEFATINNLEIYLNPVFSYGKLNFPDVKEISERLVNYTFKPNTIIPLHFIEFLNDLYNNKMPLCKCGANKKILTFAADGQLMMPCYHARERQLLSWNSSSKLCEFLTEEEFKNYTQQSGNLPSCKNCAVTPYFGISFSFHANKYFFLQSFADRLEHLKRDFLNQLPYYEQSSKLLQYLDEFLKIVRTLPSIEGKISTDCWHLDYMPHIFFDELYLTLLKKFAPNQSDTETNFLKNLPFFMIKWWKICIMCKLYTSHQDQNIDHEVSWIKNYLVRLEKYFFHTKNLHLSLLEKLQYHLEHIIIPASKRL